MENPQTSKRTFPIVWNGVHVNLYENDEMPASVLIAIAGKKTLWDDLTDEYHENEASAVLAYHNSSLYDIPILNTLTTPVKIMSIRAFSLYAWHKENGTEESFLMEKIKKGYNRYVNYLQNTSSFHWESLLVYMQEREPGLSEMEKHDIMMVVMYVLGNDIIRYMDNFYGKSILTNMHQNFNVTASGDKKFQALKKELERPALTQLQKTLGFKVPKSISFDQLIGTHETYLIKNVLTDQEKKEIVSNDTYQPLYTKGLYRSFKPLTGVLREMNFNDFNFLATVDVTRNELVGIYSMFISAVELERLKEEDWEMYFVGSLLLIMMGKHYHQLSDFYMENMKQSERSILQEETEQKEKQAWEKEKEVIGKDAKALESKLEEKDAYIEELERKLKQAELQNTEGESLKKEVVSLRNYAYQHQQEITPEEVNIVSSLTELKEWTAQHRAVIFGGHPNMVNKLKNELPELTYRDVDTLNRDLEFLQNQDVVFLITNYFNHPFYYKLMKELQSLPNTKLVYLTGYPNTERTMKEMWTGVVGLQNTF
jgi:hypothetical protein